MIRVKIKNNFINLLVLFLTAWIFIYDYGNVKNIFQDENICCVLSVMGIALSVHIIKGVRLYFALYGSEVKLSAYIKTYCKTMLVSLVIPYKFGEFFRMYCHGRQLKNMLKGSVVVLLDRFMDTLALMTMLLLTWIFSGDSVGKFVYALIGFLGIVSFAYFVFPSLHQFWKEYLLSAKATWGRIRALKMLDVLNKIYQEIKNVTKGRGILLYFLSFIAWAVEIGGVVFLNGIIHKDKMSDIISDYLYSALGVGDSVELRCFVLMSVLILMIQYAAIKIAEMLQEKRLHKCG